MKKPNIFDFAPSELSQDAFICWLLSWGNPETTTLDRELSKLSYRLLQAFFDKHNRKAPDQITKLEIKKQYQNIDILITINDSILIPIEDKINSCEHSNQLSRCLQQLREEGHSHDSILPIYIQTGEQSDYTAVCNAGFVPLSRAEFLDILKTGTHVNNDILKDYVRYLEEIEIQVQSFRHLSLDQWNWYSWQGFYNILQTELNDGEWGYVPNARGGFLGFWWYRYGDDECEQYFQLEENKLCFKIAVEDEAKQADLKWKWNEIILKASETSSLSVIKPVLRNGTYMTVAVVDGDYRMANENGKIDLDRTLETVKEAQRILDRAAIVKTSFTSIRE